MCPRPSHPYADAPRLPRGPAGELAAGLVPADRGVVTVDQILPGDGPIEIEIGPGRGGFVFERCVADPTVRLLGLEVRLKWATIVDRRLAAQGLGARARVLAEDAKVALPRLGPDGSVRAFFVHFPDPWWKKRHEKRLVVGDVLLTHVVRLLAPGGELFVQTDVEDRALRYAAEIEKNAALVPAGDASGSPVLAENPYGARSPREHRAIADGLPVHRFRWRKV
jgi:tRNA (guanine-N7-)-methyltransferase